MAMDIAMDRGKGIRSKPWALSACRRVGPSIGQRFTKFPKVWG